MPPFINDSFYVFIISNIIELIKQKKKRRLGRFKRGWSKRSMRTCIITSHRCYYQKVLGVMRDFSLITQGGKQGMAHKIRKNSVPYRTSMEGRILKKVVMIIFPFITIT